MPYKSDAQRRFMHAKHPEIAAQWDSEIRRKKKGRVAKYKKRTLQGLGVAAVGGALANQIPPVQNVVRDEKRKKKKVSKSYEPVWIQKMDDPFFNNDVASKVFTLVAKMDDDEAEMFAYFVGCEMLDQDIQKNLRTLQSHLDDVVSKRLARVKNAVFSVAKRDGVDEEAVAYAAAVFRLEEISKAAKNQYSYNQHFVESNVRRSSGGQFATKVKVNPKAKPWSDGQMAAMGHAKANKQIKSMKGLSSSQKAQYQQEYLQLANFLDTFTQGGGDAADKVIVHVKDKQSGNTYSVPSTMGTAVPAGAWDPRTEQVVGVEARPSQMKMAGASYNLGQALGASPEASRAMGFYGERLDANMPVLADQWTTATPGDVANTNARTYGRVQTGSQFVGAVARPGSAVHTAARLAEFAGSHGPEAEKVFGPAARKTAYRYRGTEKAPDAHIVELYGRAIRDSKRSSPAGPEVEESQLRMRKPREGAPPAVGQMAAHRGSADDRAPTWRERDAGRAVIMQQLGFNVPNRRLFGLQLAAGNTPPSEGILLNRDGQIVSQAVGYGDDHYLPFNLKNLKALKGGEYIRTRSVGGPTSEDIYTGLLAGARQVTVISRSGTFTVKFDETLRGGRRYNDKAMRMTDRYEHLLDALESEQVDSKPIPDHVRARIEGEIERDYAGWSPVEQRKMFKQKEEEYKAFGTGLTKEDKNYISARVQLEADRDPGVDRKQVERTLTSEVMADKEFKFRLNGEGYKSALQALQEQFPYYIKVTSTPRREPDLAEPETDKGYVMPRHNRPANALHGYFNPRIAGEGTVAYQGQKAGKQTGKISAAEADYQNLANAGKAIREPGAKPEEAATGGGTASTGGGEGGAPENLPGQTPEQKKQSEVIENITDRKDEQDFGTTAWNLIGGITRGAEYNRLNPIAAMVDAGDRAGFDKKIATPEGRAELTRMISASAPIYLQAPGGLYATYAAANAKVDRKVYADLTDRWDYGDKPYKFVGDAYKKKADKKLAGDLLTDLNNHARPVSSTKSYREMSDQEKKAELNMLFQLEQNRGNLKANAAGQKDIFTAMGIGNHSNAATLLSGKDTAIQKQAKMLHQIRTLQSNMQETGTATAPAKDVDYNPTEVAGRVDRRTEQAAGGAVVDTGVQAPRTSEKRSVDLSLLSTELHEKASGLWASHQNAATIVDNHAKEIDAALKKIREGGIVHPDELDQLEIGANELKSKKPEDITEAF